MVGGLGRGVHWFLQLPSTDDEEGNVVYAHGNGCTVVPEVAGMRVESGDGVVGVTVALSPASRTTIGCPKLFRQTNVHCRHATCVCLPFARLLSDASPSPAPVMQADMVPAWGVELKRRQ